MHTYTRKLSIKVLTLILVLSIFSGTGFAQTTVVDCPQGYICLTQAEANAARDAVKQRDAANNKITVLEGVVVEKDKTIAEIKDTAQKNQADLTDRLHKTEVELATKTGQLIGAESEKTRLTSIIDFMLKNGRKKCQPFSICIN